MKPTNVDGLNVTIDESQIDLERTTAGVFVWAVDTEHRDHLDHRAENSRRLIGFAEVEDDDALRDELIRRGLGTGAVHNLPRFEPWEVGL
jgi:hypothetical protein